MPPQDPTQRLDQQRRTLDAAEESRRATADTQRKDQRALHDRTRQHGRGDRQAHESLERERHAEDLSRTTERADGAKQRRAERAFTDKLASNQTGARDSAEEALDACEVRANDRTGELRRVMRSTAVELRGIAGLVDAIRKDTPILQGLERGRVTENANAIAAAVDRVQRLLGDVLDREDASSRTHDVGGSG